jgi:LAO/AO transport system kinase
VRPDELDGGGEGGAGAEDAGHLYAVNPAARPGADELARELRSLLRPLGHPDRDAWLPPIVKASGAGGAGLDKLWAAINAHRRHLEGSGGWEARVETMARAEIRALVWAELNRRYSGEADGGPSLDNYVRQAASRQLSPQAAADALLDASRPSAQSR